MVAQCGDVLVGLLSLRLAPDYVEVENVAVAANMRAQGIGSLLLGLAEEQTRTAGVPELRLYTNALMIENHAYYRRHGYQEPHRASEHGSCISA